MNAAELAQHALEQAQLMNQQFYNGLGAGKRISAMACAALKVAYERAQKDESAKIPSTLSCAIENILRLHEEQKANDYANDAIKRDKEVPQWERELRTGALDRTVGQ